MKWSEIQLESLKKMFLNKDVLKSEDLSTYKTDKKYKTYLDAMPQACNEAVNYIIEKEPIIRKHKLNRIGENEIYDLATVLSDYRKLYNIESDILLNWKLLSKNILKICDWVDPSVKVDVLYSAYPKKITSETTDDFKIELEESFARIIPLYIAGELYKDDDLTLSTIYMNEFFTNLNNLATNDNFINNQIQNVFRMEI